MKVGSLVYATDSGLGILAKSFHDHGIVTDALVIRHGRHKTHEEWYPGSVTLGRLSGHDPLSLAQAFCASMDVMLFFETPFLWDLLPFCRERGVKTVIMPMHECMPKNIPHQPDLWLCPSGLDVQWANTHMVNPFDTVPEVCFLPVPVEVPWRQRTRAEVFVHNAGHGGLKGRNGTAELLEAVQQVRSPARFLIRSQKPIECKLRNSMQNVTLIHGNFRHEQMFLDGDVFVFPEKFNGLSLPLQEARAAGMLVMTTDRFPMNTWLPNGPLIPARGTELVGTWRGFGPVESSIVDPQDIAARIDEWYGQDISEYSQSGKAWAEGNSWAVLGPRYKQVLEDLCA